MSQCELLVCHKQNQLEINLHPQMIEQLAKRLVVLGASYEGAWNTRIVVYAKKDTFPFVDVEKFFHFQSSDKP